MASLGSLRGTLSLDVSRWVAGSRSAAAAMRRLNVALARTEKVFRRTTRQFNRSSQALKRIGTSAGGVGLAALTGVTSGFGIGSALNLVSNFSKQVGTLAGVTGASSERIAELTAQSKRLGATTVFTASQVAQAQVNLARGGLDVNEILSATPQVLTLAQAGNLSLAEASKILTTVTRGMGLAFENSTSSINVLVRSANTAPHRVEDIGLAFEYVASVARGVGISFQEVVGAISVFASVGVVGEKAGTALRAVLSKLATLPAKGLKILERFGLTANEVNPALSDLTTVLIRLRDAGLGERENIGALGGLFETRGAAATLGLLKNIQAFINRTADLNNAFNENSTIAEDTANKINETIFGAITALTSAFQGLILQIAALRDTELEKFFRDAADAIRGVIADRARLRIYSDIFLDLLKVLRFVIEHFNTLLRVVLGLVGAKVLAGFLRLITLIGTGLVLAVFRSRVAFAALFGLIRRFFLFGAVQALWEIWVNRVELAAKAANFLENNLASLTNVLSNVGNAIIGVINFIARPFLPIIDFFRILGRTIANVVGEAIDNVKDFGTTVTDSFDFIDVLRNTFRVFTFIGLVLQGIIQTFKDLANLAGRVGANLSDVFSFRFFGDEAFRSDVVARLKANAASAGNIVAKNFGGALSNSLDLTNDLFDSLDLSSLDAFVDSLAQNSLFGSSSENLINTTVDEGVRTVAQRLLGFLRSFRKQVSEDRTFGAAGSPLTLPDEGREGVGTTPGETAFLDRMRMALQQFEREALGYGRRIAQNVQIGFRELAKGEDFSSVVLGIVDRVQDVLYDITFKPLENALAESFQQGMLEGALESESANIFSGIFSQLSDGLSSILGSLGGLFGSTGFFGSGGAQEIVGPPSPFGTRQGGGPVVPNQTYLIGEKGPEYVRFGRSGRVFPNGSGLGGVTYNININSTDGPGVRRAIEEAQPVLTRLAVSAMTQQVGRAGPVRSAIRSAVS